MPTVVEGAASEKVKAAEPARSKAANMKRMDGLIAPGFRSLSSDLLTEERLLMSVGMIGVSWSWMFHSCPTLSGRMGMY
jgi:hypothetical protein